jgi:hypothetical protein
MQIKITFKIQSGWKDGWEVSEWESDWMSEQNYVYSWFHYSHNISCTFCWSAFEICMVTSHFLILQKSPQCHSDLTNRRVISVLFSIILLQ